MALIIIVLFYFFLLLSFGMIICAPSVKLQDTGTGFGKLVLSISAVSALCAFAFSFFKFVEVSNVFRLILGGGAIALVCNYFSLGEKVSRYNVVLYITSICLFLAAFLTLIGSGFSAWIYWGSSVVYLGSIVFAMVLGHYYLVVPRLSEKPLLVLHYTFWIAMLPKIGLTIMSAREMDLSMSMTQMWDLIFVIMRVLWGYVALAVLSYYSYQLSKMRSTQSATGVLYVMVFFVLIGELIALYYYAEGKYFL